MKINPNQLPQANSQSVPKIYNDVAEGMETQFARMMIEEMRKTAKPEKSSTAEDIYQSYLNQEHAEVMAKTDSLGLKKVILDQIAPKQRPPTQVMNRENIERSIE